MKKFLFSMCLTGIVASISAQTKYLTDSRFNFPIPEREYNCMSSFRKTGEVYSGVNNYLLAKMSQLVYSDQVDYQIRFLRNQEQPLPFASSNDYIRTIVVNDQVIEKAFAARCSHWFYDPATKPVRPVVTVIPGITNQVIPGKNLPINNVVTGKDLQIKNNNLPDQPVNIPPDLTSNKKDVTPDKLKNFTPANGNKGTGATPQTYEEKLAAYLADSVNWDRENLPVFKYLSANLTVRLKIFDTKVPAAAWDPELMIVSHKDLVIIVYRGTDGGLGVPPGNLDWTEWVGTNATAFQVAVTTGGLRNTSIHAGFLGAFALIEPALTTYLGSLDAQSPAKKIWVTGHSLGGAMAQITGVFLKREGYNVQGVYTYASPRPIGNVEFAQLADRILPGRIQRFEYYLDPVTLVWAPGYENFGVRNWYDNKDMGCPSGDNCYVMHRNIAQRYFSLNPCDFNRCLNDNRSDETIRLSKAMKSGFLPDHPIRMIDHSVQWYVKSSWNQLSNSEQQKLPKVNDTWPFLYTSGPK